MRKACRENGPWHRGSDPVSALRLVRLPVRIPAGAGPLTGGTGLKG